MIYPIKFQPVYKEKVWGGTKLKDYFHKKIKGDIPIGESWELSAHQEGISIVSNGEFKGKSLRDFLKEKRKEIYGRCSDKWGNEFPLLIKFIDANDKLSVQVHPNNEYAMKYENSLGKTEMWYVVDAKLGAKIVYGLKKDITKEKFVQAIKDNDLSSTLREIEVRKGDLVLIPAGTIHAISAGILIAEIQQSSDLTYRVYDWDRLGLEGKPRELHLAKALDVINFEKYMDKPKINNLPILKEGYKISKGVSCAYFNVDILDLGTYYTGNLNGKYFEVLICIDGGFEIKYEDTKYENLVKGETVLLPANLGNFIVKGKGRVLRVRP